MSQSDGSAVVNLMTQERPPNRLRWPQYGPVLRGWIAGDMGKPISDNPHEPHTDDWYEWRLGWFTRDRGEDAIVPCETWDEVPKE